MSEITAWVDFGGGAEGGPERIRHCFGSPRAHWIAQSPQDVRSVLDAAHQAAKAGAWCLGYVRYEAATAFDSALPSHAADGPLAWFAVFDAALPWQDPAPHHLHGARIPDLHWSEGWTPESYASAIDALVAGIGRGDFYQVNFTGQVTAHATTCATTQIDCQPSDPVAVASGNAIDDGAALAAALFARLQQAQPGGYAMLLNTGTERILSVSPELFFDWRNGAILARPMKGTAARGLTPADDAAQAQALCSSPKERAENVMIVDLLRNDLSRLAQPFSVQVPRLFHAQALPTLWQMTSDVTAQTRPDVGLADVFSALFPCGSITGAPKAQAMHAIRDLESGPRGIYCGALGLLQPGGTATFNVPIRTVTMRTELPGHSVLRYGVGSGITAGSVAELEWNECRQKQAFVRRASRQFAILETLRLENGLWQNWRGPLGHAARLARTALHFGFSWSHAAQAQLAQAMTDGAQQHAQGAFRVRLLWSAHGAVELEFYPQAAAPASICLALAETPFSHALDPVERDFVQFKTTWRAHYEAYAPSNPAVFDTILWNARGELTECTRGNLALLLDGTWYTPPLQCGLLGGIARGMALAQGRLHEAVMPLEALQRAQGIAFINSLRGWLPAQLNFN